MEEEVWDQDPMIEMESHIQERAGDIAIAVLPREENEDKTPVPMARNSCHELGCNLHECASH